MHHRHTVHTAGRGKCGIDARIVENDIVLLPCGQRPSRVVLKPDPAPGIGTQSGLLVAGTAPLETWPQAHGSV
jgi:hypothetical protein